MSPWGLDTYLPVKISATEAEIIKYAGNVYFARKVNFANLLANLSAKHGVEYENVRKGMLADYRIGDFHLDVLYGGFRGFAGYCLPKDLSALIKHLDEIGCGNEAKLLKEDEIYNEELLTSQGIKIKEASVHNFTK